MGARSKLNSAHINGALLVAGLIGGMTGSWAVFGLALAGVLVTEVISGGIRLNRRDHK